MSSTYYFFKDLGWDVQNELRSRVQEVKKNAERGVVTSSDIQLDQDTMKTATLHYGKRVRKLTLSSPEPNTTRSKPKKLRTALLRF